jgi:hypothetical protein
MEEYLDSLSGGSLVNLRLRKKKCASGNKRVCRRVNDDTGRCESYQNCTPEKQLEKKITKVVKKVLSKCKDGKVKRKDRLGRKRCMKPKTRKAKKGGIIYDGYDEDGETVGGMIYDGYDEGGEVVGGVAMSGGKRRKRLGGVSSSGGIGYAMSGGKRRKSNWQTHLKRVAKMHKGLSASEIAKIASRSY